MLERLRRTFGEGNLPPSNPPPTKDRSDDRVPPGQFVASKLTVMTAGSTPRIDLAKWRLRLHGLVAKPVELTWEQFSGLPVVDAPSDFHCVTQWSRLNAGWGGVPASALLDLCQPLPEAKYVMLHCYGGYTANITLDDLRGEGVLFASRLDGGPLPVEHGGPMRLVVPHLYGWKSAKWLNSVEFKDKDEPGFWEVRGYHMRADPWLEQRFWND
ncbi:MAG: sulfite oxidase-like oxidoreductase [SAR202 cluster bacterium]|nr:sulfite oxidase-like oxidoreductase [SAR202 cluster bacterium]